MLEKNIKDLLDKFDRIFSATLSSSYQYDFSKTHNLVTETLGYGSVTKENNETVLYIFTGNLNGRSPEELVSTVLAYDQDFNKDGEYDYEPIKKEEILFVNFIFLEPGEWPDQDYSQICECYFVFTDVQKLWGSKNKKLLEVKRIWHHEELTEELYYELREKYSRIQSEKEHPTQETIPSVEEDVDDEEQEDIQKLTKGNLIAEKVYSLSEIWNQDLKAESQNSIFEVISLKDSGQLEGDLKEWQKYFSKTKWNSVLLISDHQLHTGTLIFYDYEELKGKDLGQNREASLIKDISWVLLKVLSYRQKNKGQDQKLHSISFLAIDDFEDSDEIYLSTKIINKVQQQSELLHETKLIPVKKSKVDTYTDSDWEEELLANHLIPLRRKEKDYDQLRKESIDISKEMVEKLKNEKNQIEAHLIMEKLSDPKSSLAQEEINLLRKTIEFIEKLELIHDQPSEVKVKQKVDVIESLFIGIKLFTERPLTIELQNNLNLIFAPNGYGKSTIVDGLKNMVIDHSHLLEHDHLPLWNVKKEDSIGVFGTLSQRAGNKVYRLISKQVDQSLDQPVDQSLIKESYIGGLSKLQKDSNQTVNIDPEVFNLFCYSSELKEHLYKEMIHLLIKRLIPQLDLDQVPALGEVKLDVLKKVNQIIESFKEQILEKIKKYFLGLLKVCTTMMTADSWLYTLTYDFDVDRGVRLKKASEKVDKGTQRKNAYFELKQVLNMGEQKVVDLAIFFLFYYFEGCKYSDVVILDDVFATFDERQCYNFLRFIMTFRNLPKMQNSQFIILSHRKSIFDYFYYGNLRYLNQDDQILAGYYNFINRKEKKEGKEKYSKYIEKWNPEGESLDDVRIDEIPVTKE